MRYTVKSAALATGVAEDRLRTWERRYGVPAPGRSATGRRLYTEEDLAVIRRMASLVDSGLSASSAAAAVAEGAQVSLANQAPRSLDPLVSALLDRVETLDERPLFQILESAERSIGIEAALEDVALPALVEVGRRWERSDVTVAVEHFLAECVRAWMTAVSRSAAAPSDDAPRALVACPADERHDVGALAFALLLRRAGLRVTYLGADVPTSSLVDALRKGSFRALCLSVTATTSLPMARVALGALRATGGATRLYVGGRAIDRASDRETEVLPAILLPSSITAAARMLAAQAQTPPGSA